MMTENEAKNLTAREYAIATNATLMATAKAEGWTFWTTLPEDEAYWAEQAATYKELTGADVMRRELVSTHYDMYKDVYGIRPRWINYENLTIDELDGMIKDLSDASKAEQEREEREEREIAERTALALKVTPLIYSPFANLKLENK